MVRGQRNEVEHPPHKGALERSGGGKQQAHREKGLIRGPGGKEGGKTVTPEGRVIDLTKEQSGLPYEGFVWSGAEDLL